MLDLSKPGMPRLRFPEEWQFQSPHIITALNSETPEQEAPEVPSVSLTRETAEEPCCCLEAAGRDLRNLGPGARNVQFVLPSSLICSPDKSCWLITRSVSVGN